MKRLFVLFIGFAMIFCGCNINVNIEQSDELQKSCKIEIRSFKEHSLIATIDKQEIVNQFLATDDWEAVDGIPKELTPQYRLVVYQEKTLLKGQDPDEEREFEIIERITTYQDSLYMQVSVNPDVIKNSKMPQEFLTFNYLAPDEIMKNLQQFV